MGGMTLTSITAYRKTDTGFLTDRDFTALPILSSGLDTDESQFTQELRLASPGGETFDWVVGAYYFERDFFQNTILDLGPAFLGPGLRNVVHSMADTKDRKSTRLNSSH